MTTTLDHRPALRLTPLEPHRSTTSPRTPPTRPSTRTPGWERNSDRRDRVHLALSELFSSRHDLDGVSVVADVLAEDLLWSA